MSGARVPPERGKLSRRNLEQELARARGARRMLPWTLATAAGGAAIGFAAGGGVRAAAALLGVGLLFVLFLWVMSIARCPACGTPLRAGGRRRGAASSATQAVGEDRLETCPRCRTRFD